MLPLAGNPQPIPTVTEALWPAWVALAATIAAVLLASRIAARFPRRPPRRTPAQPVCAACAYPTLGLPTTVCPECGGDLTCDGTRTPRPAGATIADHLARLAGLWRWWLAAAWTVALAYLVARRAGEIDSWLANRAGLTHLDTRNVFRFDLWASDDPAHRVGEIRYDERADGPFRVDHFAGLISIRLENLPDTPPVGPRWIGARRAWLDVRFPARTWSVGHDDARPEVSGENFDAPALRRFIDLARPADPDRAAHVVAEMLRARAADFAVTLFPGPECPDCRRARVVEPASTHRVYYPYGTPKAVRLIGASATWSIGLLACTLIGRRLSTRRISD